MSTRRIMLSFNHPTLCGDVAVDICIPLPDPIVESCKRMAARVCPACPICKQPMQYVGFLFENTEDKEDLKRPFTNSDILRKLDEGSDTLREMKEEACERGIVLSEDPPQEVGVEALRQYAKQREHVRAVRWTGELTPAVTALLGGRAVVIATTTRSLSLGNSWYADVGDWIASADGEKIVVIGDDVFKRVYEEVPHEARKTVLDDMVYPRTYGTAAATLSFRVCSTCAATPGVPTLCEACFHNRGLIQRLRHALDELFHLADRLCTQNWPASATPRSITDRLVELKKEFDL